MKLQFIFANIGGIIVLINFHFKLVTSFINKNFIIRDIANAIFDFSEEISHYGKEDSSKQEINIIHKRKIDELKIYNNMVII
jgi:hypothetical protein